MGARIGSSITVTVAAPVLAPKVENRSDYLDVVAEVRDATRRLAVEMGGDEISVAINQADLGRFAYLTLSGTSAEAGDDGQVGRGNRFGGLITPYRPMSLEAAAGKNPAAHVSKTYHGVGADIARRLLAESDITEVTVRLLSSIGHPVTEAAGGACRGGRPTRRGPHCRGGQGMSRRLGRCSRPPHRRRVRALLARAGPFWTPGHPSYSVRGFGTCGERNT